VLLSDSTVAEIYSHVVDDRSSALKQLASPPNMTNMYITALMPPAATLPPALDRAACPCPSNTPTPASSFADMLSLAQAPLSATAAAPPSAAPDATAGCCS
jgi:hypothetical protein